MIQDNNNIVRNYSMRMLRIRIFCLLDSFFNFAGNDIVYLSDCIEFRVRLLASGLVCIRKHFVYVTLYASTRRYSGSLRFFACAISQRGWISNLIHLNLRHRFQKRVRKFVTVRIHCVLIIFRFGYFFQKFTVTSRCMFLPRVRVDTRPRRQGQTLTKIRNVCGYKRILVRVEGALICNHITMKYILCFSNIVCIDVNY